MELGLEMTLADALLLCAFARAQPPDLDRPGTAAWMAGAAFLGSAAGALAATRWTATSVSGRGGAAAAAAAGGR